MKQWRIGECAEFSKTISEYDISAFAGLTGDMNPIHIDGEAAERSFAGKRVAHGAYIAGLISNVIGMKLPGPGSIYLEQDSRFRKPVYLGDTVTAAVEVTEILNNKKGILKLSTAVRNQKEETVLEGYAVVKAPAEGGGTKMRKISDTAQIAKTAVIHDNVEIEDNVVIHDYVVIYPNTLIKSGTEIFDHCVIGKPPASPGITSRELKKELPRLVVGENCVLSPGVVLYTGSAIGSRCLLGDFCSIREECRVGDRCIVSRNVSVNYHTQIGDDTKIMDNTHITGNMKIGNHVFISTLVATTNDNTMGRQEYREEHVRGAVIEDGATIGAAANILPGVSIGANAIVGASALVTRDVPRDKVVMGIPARVIREVDK